MKGFVNIVEMIIIVIVLFVAFSILFPGFVYTSKWSEALTILKSKDLVLAVDRIGKLYDYSFNAVALQGFLDIMIPTNETGLIPWSEAEGTIKSKVVIACNCTGDQINNLTSWFNGLEINGRDIDSLVCYSNLDPVNPCIDRPGITPDVFLIWGYKNLSSYLGTLESFIGRERGIVEIMDLNATMVLEDNAQEKIFGLGADQSSTAQTQKGMSKYDVFRDEVASLIKRPINTTVISYRPWKYFYHIPVPLFATPTSTIPTDNLPEPSCNQISNGVFEIQTKIIEIDGQAVETPESYDFWICDSNKVYFDTDLTGKANVVLNVDDNFGIVDYYNSSLFWNFTLNYIDGQEKIGISFRSKYKFSDFVTYGTEEECVCPPEKPGKCPKGEAAGLCKGKKEWAGTNVNLIAPSDGELDRILIQASNKTEKETPIPGVILNTTEISRTAWMADFAADGVGDDERLLLISLLLWASNKRAMGILLPEIKVGFKTSYVNTVNKDMFEIYKFNLGLGYPF